MFKSHHKQFEELVESWGLTPEQVDIEYFLVSHHAIGRLIRKRIDTGQYIYIEYEDAFDLANDYFRWKYLTEEQLNKFTQEEFCFRART